MIMQQEMPDEGYIKPGPSVRPAYPLPQIIHFSNEERSLLDTMLYDCRCQPQEARDRLAAFGFRGEDVFTPVGALSGGEKSCLRLCMLMGSDINLLILDEPDKPFDIASREWMEVTPYRIIRGAAVRFARQIFYRKICNAYMVTLTAESCSITVNITSRCANISSVRRFSLTAKAEAKAAKPDKSAKKSSPNKEKAHSKDRA